MTKKISAFFLIALLTTVAFSQDWDWGDDIILAKGKYNQLKIFIESNELDRARAPIQWLLKNTPSLNVALYQKATKVYERLVKEGGAQDKIDIFQDSVLWLYDERMARFGDNAKVLNLKGKLAWRYLSKDLEQRPNLLSLYSRIYYLNGENTYPENFYYHFLTLCSLNESEGAVSDEELVESYNSFSNKMEKQLTNAKSKKSKQRVAFYKLRLDQSFEKYVKLDCGQVVEQYGDKFDKNPTIQLAKQIFTQLKNGRCYNSDYFGKTLAFILQEEPNANWYAVLGKYQLLQNDMLGARRSYEKALELCINKSKKAEWNLALANIYRVSGSFVKARNLAKEAAKSVNVQKEAYKFIGDLYFYYSHKACRSEDPIQTKSIYIAAYEMYKRAGNSQMMQEARQYFPTMEEIFQRNYTIGDDYNTGCWINEKVQLQKK